MKNKHLRWVLMSGTVVLVGIFVVQAYWFKKAFDVSAIQFDHTVQVALKKVADSVSRNAAVKKLSSNFFFVETNSALDDQHIDSLLKKELLTRKLKVDYELGVYRADDDTLVYGNYVPATEKLPLQRTGEALNHTGSQKNFAVYFPSRESYITAQLNVWIFSSVILLLMVLFFVYAIYSLLRERKFSELKNDFVNNMTHEFKTPVTNIGIAAEALKNKPAIRDDVKVYLDIVLKENEKLRQKIDLVLTGESLDYRNRPSFEVLDLHELIAGCAARFRLKVQERGGNLVLKLTALHPFILGDKELLAQAISNIIDNAEKYSVDEPNIIVYTKDTVRGIEILVEDEGIGIAPSMKAKVFDKFFRISSGNIHAVKGFGLGLSFVKNIVRSHRGRINLFSELNRGTQVRITLPKV